MTPAFGLGSFQVASGVQDARGVARELEVTGAPFLLVRREADGAVLWYTFEVDDELLRRLRADAFAVEGALDLYEYPAGPVWPSDGVPATSAVWGPQGFPVLDPAAEIIRGLATPGGTTQGVLFPEITASVAVVRPQQTIELAVALAAASPLGPALPLDLEFPPGVERLSLLAFVESDHFSRPEGESWQTSFSVSRNLEVSPAAGWTFKARATGPRASYRLTVSFLCGGALAGRVQYTLAAAGSPEAAPPSSSGGTISIQPSVEVPHTVTVARTPTGAFELRFLDKGEPAGWVPVQFSRNYLQQLEQASDLARVVELGESIYDDLSASSRALVEWLERSSGPLTIVSREPAIPFELLQLRPERNGPLLGVERPVARALDLSEGVPTTLVVDRAACIRPDYPSPNALPDAAGEEAELGARVVLERGATQADLDALLGRGDLPLVHFAGHAEGDPAQLFLQDGAVSPTRFRRSSPLLRSHPFVFLNGCRAGHGQGDGPSVQRNMTATFLQRGAAGVLAPLIRVKSPSARRAAGAFYEACAEGFVVAEAVRRVRALALDPRAGHAPTFLSYLIHAPPSLRLSLPA